MGLYFVIPGGNLDFLLQMYVLVAVCRPPVYRPHITVYRPPLKSIDSTVCYKKPFVYLPGSMTVMGEGGYRLSWRAYRLSWGRVY